MRFIHTSDWHLGRLFNQESLQEDQAYVLQQILAYAIEHKVEAILLSGDIYDRSSPPVQAIQLFDQFLEQLNAVGIRMIMISGNHDSSVRVGFAAHALERGGIFIKSDLDDATKPVVIKPEQGKAIHIYGLPYIDPEYVSSFYQLEPCIHSYQQAHQLVLDQMCLNSDAVNILLAHCFIDGAAISESERQLSVGGATAVAADTFSAFDYVALGHMHGEQYRTHEHIRYSGSILKYSFSEEEHIKAVTLVDVSEEGVVSWQSLTLKPIREVRTIEGMFADILEAAKTDPQADDYIRVILHDTAALLEPMSQLREYYPNILKLEKSIFKEKISGLQANSVDLAKRTEIDIFNDFYQAFIGQPLSEEQEQIMHDIVKQIRAED
ncbi:MAG: exonuclease SbcCD subunit D [Pelistega sp.]|nr:exonuclease SbcCD subunit D [Pelistega sp.]